jgi:hypothetical protein
MPAIKERKKHAVTSTERMRRLRSAGTGEFKTKKYSYGENADSRSSARLQKREVQACARRLLTVIHSSYQDVIKWPYKMPSVKPRPALFFEGGPNMYFGRDKGRKREGTVHRFAYATGSGTNTIGINPTELRIYPWCVELDELWKAVLLSLPKWMKAVPWNAVSCKFYDCYQESWKNGPAASNKKHVHCGLHRDVQWKIDGRVADDSSQIPGTPVLICSFGGKKMLWFKKKIRGLLPADGGTVEDFTKFLQSESSCIILHPSDEKWCKRPDNLYQTFLHHTKFDEKLCGNDQMIATIMFRCVRKTVRVSVADGYLSDVPIPTKESVLFEKARTEWGNDPKLKAAHTERLDSWKEKLMGIIQNL